MCIRSKLSKLVKGNNATDRAQDLRNKPTVIHKWKTDKGKIRKNNEDNVYYDDKLSLFILADGIGGHEGGEKASEIAVEKVSAILNERLLFGLKKTKNTRDVREIFNIALKEANNRILETARKNKDLDGMGTTIVLSYIPRDEPNTFYVTNVGDSRAYLIRQDHGVTEENEAVITQLTEDHSIAAEMVRKGHMTPGQATAHRLRHTIYQSLGVSSFDFEPPTKCFKWKKNDVLLLCSDGLTDMLADEEIRSTILEYQTNNTDDNEEGEGETKDLKERQGDIEPTEKEQKKTESEIKIGAGKEKAEREDKHFLRRTCEELVRKANDKGGRDNITVIVIQNEYDDRTFENNKDRTLP